MNLLNSYVVYIFLIPISIWVDVCDCAPIKNWRTATIGEFEYVADVFIADVQIISENQTAYQLTICEVFKGNLKVGQTVLGINPNYCAPTVNKKGKWLFFGTYKTNFNLNVCGLTGNIEEPWQILPPPPPPELKAGEKGIIENWKKQARKNMQEQITILRDLKIKANRH